VVDRQHPQSGLGQPTGGILSSGAQTQDDDVYLTAASGVRW